jgi:hypothetical protein
MQAQPKAMTKEKELPVPTSWNNGQNKNSSIYTVY